MSQNTWFFPVVCLLSGFITAMSMPGYDLWFLAWVGFIPLILAIKNTHSLKMSILCSFAFGLSYNLLTLIWLAHLHPLKWLGFTFIQSLALTGLIWTVVSAYASIYLCLFGISIYFAAKSNFSILVKSLIIALGWSLIVNKLMSVGEFGFPWSMIEYSQYKNLDLIQFAQYIGGIGVGFFIVFINSLFAFIILEFNEKMVGYKGILVKIASVLTFICLVHYVGSLMLNAKPSKTVMATVIQTNLTVEKEKQSLTSFDGNKKFFLKQIKKAPSGIIVAPETAIMDFIRLNEPEFCRELKNIAKTQNKTLVIGMLDVDYNNEHKLGPTNSAMIFDRSIINNHNDVYNKLYLVPFGEYVPLYGFLPDFLKKLASTAAKADFTRGKQVKVISTAYGKIAPSICYDIIFPALTTSQMQNNADILVNLSNLSWFHNSIIKEQFIAFSVFRAAESRKPMVVSVNTGNSVIIDFNGKILKMLKNNFTGLASTTIGYTNEKSIFSKTFF